MIIKENACPCGYCEYFKVFEYNKNYTVIQKGVCIKHELIRDIYDELCEDFVLMKGVHTPKWYPTKNQTKK